MAISISKSQRGCPERDSPDGKVRQRAGLAQHCRQERTASVTPTHEQGPLQCLDLTFLGPASPGAVHSSAGAGGATQPVLPCLSLQGFPSPSRFQLRPSSGVSARPAPPTSLCFLSVSACFAAVLSTRLSLAWRVCFCLFSAAGSASRVSMFAFCHLFHQKQKLPESKDWKMATLSNVFHSRASGPAASLMLGGGWTTPQPLGWKLGLDKNRGHALLDKTASYGCMCLTMWFGSVGL